MKLVSQQAKLEMLRRSVNFYKAMTVATNEDNEFN
jgi:hypothetical protein